jgi:hypothetical protein
VVVAAIAVGTSQSDPATPAPVGADSGITDAGPTPSASSPESLSAVPATPISPPPTAAGPRPDNAAVLIDRGPNGQGILTINNGTQLDAVVTLAVAEDAKHSIFVQAGNEAQLKSIADATYTIYVQQGGGWNNDLQIFTENAQYSKFDTPATFTTKKAGGSVQYTKFSITLHPVIGGTADIVDIDPAAVPR